MKSRLLALKEKLCFLLFSFFIHLLVHAQEKTGTVTGIVRSESGEALPNVSVIAKNSTTNLTSGTQTDKDGLFTFARLPVTGRYSFAFSMIGYEDQTLSGYQLKAEASTTILIKLRDSSAVLGNVVIIGYGSQKRAKVTSAIATVKVDSIDQGSTFNAVKMLQGRAPGVNIITPSGTPGAQPVVMVRGVGSISGGSSPLYVVDGIPNEVFPNLNPNDIESMDVLKDASAAAIYGSRANSGVIIITTKSGKSGKTVVTLSARRGQGKVYNDIKMASAAQYAAVMQVAIDNYNKQKGTALTYYQPATIQETNWVEEISRSSASTRVIDINLSGGNEKTRFFTSFGYYGQEGILKTSEYSQYNFRLKVSQVISPWIKLNANLSASAAPQDLLEETSTSLKVLRTAREEQPWYSPYLADGSYKVNGTYILRHNPVMLINEEAWKRTNYEGLGTVSLDIMPVKGLKYTPSISAYGFLVDEKKKITENMAARASTAGWGAIAQDRNLGVRYVFDNILSYDNHWKELAYTFLAGHSYEHYASNRLGAYSDNYANGAFPSSSFDVINAGANIYPSTGIGYDAYTLESYLGRVNLDYSGKYLLNANVRRDGSSRFSSQKRYGTFPSLSLGWRLTKEHFWQVNEKVLSDLKLRISYGITGSQAGIGNYAPLSLVGAGSSYNNQGGFVLSQDAQNVSWEKAKQFDVGIDAELLGGRVSLTADYYSQKTTDLLYGKPIYATSGFTNIPSNIGALQNNGLELALSGRILTGRFKWTVAGNVSFVDNKLLSLYNNTSMYIVPAAGSNLLGGQSHALINGKAIGAFYMYRQTGIYQDDKEVPAKLFSKGVRAGDVIYHDVNGDGDITDADREYTGKAIPDMYGGLTSNLRWKGIELNIFSQFSKGSKILSAWRGANGTEGTDHLGNALSSITVDNGQKAEQFFNISAHAATTYWNGPGTSTTTPRPVRQGVFTGYTYGYNNLTSTRFLEDGSYFKIKTLTLAYNLPPNLLQRWKMGSVRLYMSVDNLLTFTPYSGYDPEQSYALNPGDANYGIDFGLQPALRTVLFGVNIKF